MEPEGLLPCSQKAAICPCPEAVESSKRLPTLFPKDPF
jgi:hypothetical protein